MASTSAGSTACRLAAVGFSNLSRDHLDYHPTVDAYREAKLRLFRELAPEAARRGRLGRRVRRLPFRRRREERAASTS